MIIQIKKILDINDYKIYRDYNDVTRLAYHNVELVVFMTDKTTDSIKSGYQISRDYNW